MKKSSGKSKIRVLLADDHRIVRSGIRQLLQGEADLQVIAEADDGEEAQALIAKLKPDVAVLDIQMPKASGIEVTRWVRAHLPEVGVLILTAYNDDPYVMAVLQAGANGYVLKTAEADELIQAVRDVNEGKSALDPSVTQKLMSSLFKRPEKADTVEPLTDRELEVVVEAGGVGGAVQPLDGTAGGSDERTIRLHALTLDAQLPPSPVLR
jgi:DNA-binding NarL/FixJ family response regulator